MSRVPAAARPTAILILTLVLMIVGALIFVGVPQGNTPGPEYADVAIVSLLHVAKVDVLQPVATTEN